MRGAGYWMLWSAHIRAGNLLLISPLTKQKLGKIKTSLTIHEFASIARNVIKVSQRPPVRIQTQCGSWENLVSWISNSYEPRCTFNSLLFPLSVLSYLWQAPGRAHRCFAHQLCGALASCAQQCSASAIRMHLPSQCHQPPKQITFSTKDFKSRAK